ncbi:MAG: NAD(P)H-quinone oxidoreductase [Gammaproteobacteria bacterium]|nr:NAD(P)H-quinone oxidoreductase [Gammaproteobacteria bacterium]
MKAIGIAEPGGPEVLKLVELPVPQVRPTEVLIRVAAAGLNRADILQRRGRYPPPPGAPSHPGLEVSGHVAAVGSAATRFRVGDAVCALLEGGGYAEYAAVDERQVLTIPKGVTLTDAAALPEACFTVWSNLIDRGRLRGKDTLLVHGGSSGIGTTAIQLATALGHTVFTTAGTEEKCRFCERLGAARAINYRREDFVEAIATLTQGRGVDVVLDMVGGSYLQRNLRVLAEEGRLVVIATQGGTLGELDVLRLMRHRLTVTGSTLRNRSTEFKDQVRRAVQERMWPMIESGKIKPIVDRVFSLSDAAAAHAYMESGVHKGKILLQIP